MDVLRFTTALSGSTSTATSATNLSQSSTPTASPAPARRGPGFMSMLFGAPGASPSASGIKRVATPTASSNNNNNNKNDDDGRRSPLRVASCEGPMMVGAVPVAATATTMTGAQRVHMPVMRKLW